MFVRKKTTASGTVKHYLVTTRRESGKVRQKVLFYLGEHASVDAALMHFDEQAAAYKATYDELEAQVAVERKDLGPWSELAHKLHPEKFSRVACLRYPMFREYRRFSERAAQLRQIIETEG